MIGQALFMRDHLMWTRSGVIWATWRLTGLPYGIASDEAGQLVRAQHRALFQGLRGEALLLGVHGTCPAREAVASLVDGVDRPSAEWEREVSLFAAQTEANPVEERTYWLSVPLATSDLRGKFRSLATIVEAEARLALALPRRVPSLADIRDAHRAASRIADLLPKAFQARPAQPSELIWLAERAVRRGLRAVSDIARPHVATPSEHVVPASAMTGVFLDEGGTTDLEKRPLLRNPFTRRFLKVHGARSASPSYQVMLTLAHGPKGGWEVPGVEWLAALDASDVPLDWAIRLSIASGEDVRRRNRSAELSLRDQLLQQDGDGDDSLIGPGAQLGDVATSLRDYAAALGRSENEVEVQATVILAIGAATASEAQRRANVVQEQFRLSDFIFDPPLGGQQQLWSAMLPGVPTSALVRELAQLTTGHEFASAVPLVSSELGDETGLHLGRNLGTGRNVPVFLDPGATIQADRSASIGIVAELGAGKSFTLKKIAGDMVDRGARVFIIDRTESREYATFASSLLPDSTAVVDLARPNYSLDPLRLFGAEAGSRHAQSLFSSLLGVRPRDELGVELSRLLEPATAKHRGLTSLGALRRHLAMGPNEAIQRRMLGLIDLIASTELGAVLFDDSLEPVDLDARAIIPLTAGLALPTAQELDRQHLFEELPLDKIFGRAMYALLTGIARQIAFRSRELAVFCADECHHITTSPEGQGYVLDFLRDGRKHNALAMLASHDPHDFGDVRARGLIPIRLVMRHTDPLLAERALGWLERGLELDSTLIREVTEGLSPAGPDGFVSPERRGEALFRDSRQRIGKIRIVPSLRPDRRAALGSTPDTRGRAGDVMHARGGR